MFLRYNMLVSNFKVHNIRLRYSVSGSLPQPPISHIGFSSDAATMIGKEPLYYNMNKCKNQFGNTFAISLCAPSLDKSLHAYLNALLKNN